MTQTTPDPVRRQRAQVKVRTLRTDRWWLAPLLTFLGLSSFLVYGVWAIFDTSYFVDPYIAPFSSPCLATSCPEGARFLGWAPFGDWYTLPPGLLILGLPGGYPRRPLLPLEEHGLSIVRQTLVSLGKLKAQDRKVSHGASR